MLKRIILVIIIILTTISTSFYGMTPPDIGWDLFGVLFFLDKPKANHRYNSEEWSPFTSPITSPKSAKRYTVATTSIALERQLIDATHLDTNSPYFEAEELLGCSMWADSEKEHVSPEKIARHYADTRHYLLPEAQEQLAEASSHFIENIADFVHPIKTGMRIFQLLKESGCRTFILSNIPYECKEGMHKHQFLERCKKEIPQYIDPFNSSIKEIYSITTKLRKPDLQIYQLLSESMFSFKIFTDDSLKNVKAAANAGIFSISCQTHAEFYLSLLALGLLERDEVTEYLLNDDEELKILRALQYGSHTMTLDFYINALAIVFGQHEQLSFPSDKTIPLSDVLDVILEEFDCEIILKNLNIVFGHPTTYGDTTLAYEFARFTKKQKAIAHAEHTQAPTVEPFSNDVSSWLSPV